MDPLERSQDIYENVPGYPPAPQPPRPAFGDFSTLETIGLRFARFARAVMGAAMGLTGFKPFWRTLPQQIEHLQRTVNLRGPALYAQAVSATVALPDDPRPHGGRMSGFSRRSNGPHRWFGAWPASTTISSRAGSRPTPYAAQPAEMGQYANLFATSVVWAAGRPRLYKSKETGQDRSAGPGAVLHRGHGPAGTDRRA